jgi:type I restriction enzyme S subunit
MHGPDSWLGFALGDVASVTVGGTPSTEVAAFWGGNVPWMASGDVHQRRITDVPGRISKLGLRSSNATLVDPPSVAIGLAGQGKTRGTAALVERRLCTNQSVALISGDGQHLLTRYLFHELDRRYEELRARSSGGGRGGLSKGILEGIPLLLPSIQEQAVVARILDTADDAVRSTEHLIAKLVQVKQGLLHDVMTRGIDETGGVRPNADARPDLYCKNQVGQVPKDWQVGLLDSFATRGSGHTPNRNVPSYWDGGIRWVSLADSDHLDNVWIRDTDKEVSELGIANSSAVKHVDGTVILSRDAGVGKSAILVGTMAVSQHFMAWTCGPCLNNVYLYYWLQHAKPRFEAIALGSTIKTIGLSYFRRLEIGVPDRREQALVADLMLDADRLIWKTEAELSKLRAVKAGLMEDLMSGFVRVKGKEDAA